MGRKRGWLASSKNYTFFLEVSYGDVQRSGFWRTDAGVGQ
jgi:hypothetical protein